MSDVIKEEIEKEIKVKVKKLGKLVSRLNHPVNISYNGQGLVIPPRGKVRKVNKQLLGAIPKGVKYIES